MSSFEFINAQQTPQDPYVKEIVTLQFTIVDGTDKQGNYKFSKLRMPYLRKASKDGGLFWSGVSTGIQYHDKKNYISPRFSDSFFNEDIEIFLNARSWETETRVNPNSSPSAFEYPKQPQPPNPSQAFNKKEEELPF